MSDYAVLKYLTSTIGLITSCDADGRVNVMAAEWTSFVARSPLHIAVSLQTSNLSEQIIRETGRFSVTLCDVDLAPVAEMVGSFSGRHVDKVTSVHIDLDEGLAGAVPHVAGGVLNAACEVRQVCPLPGYTLFVGETTWWRADDLRAARPLVKHGPMYELGDRISSQAVAASVRRHGPSLTVAATAQGASSDDHWRVELLDAETNVVAVHEVAMAGDLLHEIELGHFGAAPSASVRVHRAGFLPGHATVPQ